ncbi:hypothetical protein VAB18032_30259 (plasmid) [Micromonospora maris AB-18-032]|nr:hypothetical protein VAB18032_30259 [Micromonospora maris AB-18-032]
MAGHRRIEHMKRPSRGASPVGAAVLVDDHGDTGRRIRPCGERRDLGPGQRRPARGHRQRRTPAFGQGDGLQRGPGDHGPARLVGLLGEPEQHLGRSEDRRRRAVQHRHHVRHAGWGVAGEADHRPVRIAVVTDTDHHPVAEPVDQLPAAASRGEPGRADLHIGEALPPKLVDQRRRPVRRVPDRPLAVDRHTLSGQPPGRRRAVGSVELGAVELGGHALSGQQALSPRVRHRRQARRAGDLSGQRPGAVPQRGGPVDRGRDALNDLPRRLVRCRHQGRPSSGSVGSSPRVRNDSNRR